MSEENPKEWTKWGSDALLNEYYHPEQVLMRKYSRDVCVDTDCDLSNGVAHVGECEPCDCELNPLTRPTPHAIAECPKNFPVTDLSIEERTFIAQVKFHARVNNRRGRRRFSKEELKADNDPILVRRD